MTKVTTNAPAAGWTAVTLTRAGSPITEVAEAAEALEVLLGAGLALHPAGGPEWRVELPAAVEDVLDRQGWLDLEKADFRLEVAELGGGEEEEEV